MATLKNTKIEGNLDVSGNLTVAGTIISTAGGGQVYSPNNKQPITVTLSSRAHECNFYAGSSATGGWYATDFTTNNLAAGEVVTGVTASGPNSTGYTNNSIWRMTAWGWDGSTLRVYMERGASDSKDPIITVSITITKIIIS